MGIHWRTEGSEVTFPNSKAGPSILSTLLGPHGTAGQGGCRMQASLASRARQHQCQPRNHDPPLPKTPCYRSPARGWPPLQRGKKSSPQLEGKGRSSVGTNTKVTADSGVMPESQGQSLPGHLSPSSTTYLGSKGPRKFP